MIERYAKVVETRKRDGATREVRYVVQSAIIDQRRLAPTTEERYAKARDAWEGFRIISVRTKEGRALADIESVAYPREDLDAVIDEMRVAIARHLERTTDENGEPIEVKLVVGHTGE